MSVNNALRMPVDASVFQWMPMDASGCQWMSVNNALRMPEHQIPHCPLHPTTTTVDSGGENKQTDFTQYNQQIFQPQPTFNMPIQISVQFGQID